MGAPSTFTEELAETICDLLGEGRSLRSICADEGMPAKFTVQRWLAANESFRAQYARARELQAEHFADEIIEIVDTETDAAVARVRMDARKWAASKLAPKKYGDKIQQEHSGPDGGKIAFEWLPPNDGS